MATAPPGPLEALPLRSPLRLSANDSAVSLDGRSALPMRGGQDERWGGPYSSFPPSAGLGGQAGWREGRSRSIGCCLWWTGVPASGGARWGRGATCGPGSRGGAARRCGVLPGVRHHVPGPRNRLGQAQLQVLQLGWICRVGVTGETGWAAWACGARGGALFGARKVWVAAEGRVLAEGREAEGAGGERQRRLGAEIQEAEGALGLSSTLRAERQSGELRLSERLSTEGPFLSAVGGSVSLIPLEAVRQDSSRVTALDAGPLTLPCLTVPPRRPEAGRRPRARQDAGPRSPPCPARCRRIQGRVSKSSKSALSLPYCIRSELWPGFKRLVRTLCPHYSLEDADSNFGTTFNLGFWVGCGMQALITYWSAASKGDFVTACSLVVWQWFHRAWEQTTATHPATQPGAASVCCSLLQLRQSALRQWLLTPSLCHQKQ